MNTIMKLLTALAIVAGLSAVAVAGGSERQTAHQFELQSIDGGKLKLADWRGKAVLIVNTASFCGFTKQYEGLQSLSRKYKDKLVVLGVPSNDFSQEPKSEGEIKKFCEGAFGVTFPLSAKQHVTGDNAHELYKWLAKEAGPPAWNFHKYLIDADGRVVKAFPSRVTPQSGELTEWIEKASGNSKG